MSKPTMSLSSYQQRRLRPAVIFAYSCTLTLLHCALSWGDIQLSLRLDKNKIVLGESAALEIAVTGSSGGLGEPKIVIPSELSVYSQSKSQKIEIVNWKMTTSVIYTLMLNASKPGTHKLGPAKLDVGGGQVITSDIVTLEVLDQKSAQVPGAPQGVVRSFNQMQFPRSVQDMVGDKQRAQQPPSPAPAGPTQASPEPPPLVFVEAKMDKKEAFIGEPVRFAVHFYTRVPFLSQPQYVPPNITGFWQEDLPQRTFQTNVRGVTYHVTELSAVLFPTASGRQSVNSAKVQVELDESGNSSALDPFDPQFFQRFFGMNSGATHVLETKPVSIAVNPLPQENRPRDFSGAVGNYDIDATLDKTEIKVGEALTLTVSIAGECNIRNMPSPLYPNLEGQFRSYETEKSETISKQDGKITGKKVFKLLLIPQVPGSPNLTIPAIRFVYFDPKLRGYVRKEAGPLTIKVSGEALQQVADKNGVRQETKKIAEDIHFIEEKFPEVNPLRTLILMVSNYWMALGSLPVMMWAATLSVMTIKKRKASKKLTPLEQLISAIKKVSRSAHEQNPQALANHLAPALEAAIRQLCGAGNAGLSAKNLEEDLLTKTKGAITPDDIRFLQQTLNNLNFLRFAPTQKEESNAVIHEVITQVEEAKKILEKLE